MPKPKVINMKATGVGNNEKGEEVNYTQDVQVSIKGHSSNIMMDDGGLQAGWDSDDDDFGFTIMGTGPVMQQPIDPNMFQNVADPRMDQFLTRAPQDQNRAVKIKPQGSKNEEIVYKNEKGEIIKQSVGASVQGKSKNVKVDKVEIVDQKKLANEMKNMKLKF